MEDSVFYALRRKSDGELVRYRDWHPSIYATIGAAKGVRTVLGRGGYKQGRSLEEGQKRGRELYDVVTIQFIVNGVIEDENGSK